ncbi:hypothetical protein BCR37DRAFT_108479 [Protomyces lactucae-debilis]|uniref:Uncharacterized protein n=1 Tax=Protomyces lactucae-debilis TaxID=2754530 RepID=A0A1Y2F540_PROLT|nr:uncharacterized protein BCR37DRAFT_108479 [Protomyces lactucae-debilis]ORY78604.1 hypothetical protein BCR37DRAFT_108479 [Protomyces lactucae-debilis]
MFLLCNMLDKFGGRLVMLTSNVRCAEPQPAAGPSLVSGLLVLGTSISKDIFFSLFFLFIFFLHNNIRLINNRFAWLPCTVDRSMFHHINQRAMKVKHTPAGFTYSLPARRKSRRNKHGHLFQWWADEGVFFLHLQIRSSG